MPKRPEATASYLSDLIRSFSADRNLREIFDSLVNSSYRTEGGPWYELCSFHFKNKYLIESEQKRLHQAFNRNKAAIEELLFGDATLEVECSDEDKPELETDDDTNSEEDQPTSDIKPDTDTIPVEDLSAPSVVSFVPDLILRNVLSIGDHKIPENSIIYVKFPSTEGSGLQPDFHSSDQSQNINTTRVMARSIGVQTETVHCEAAEEEIKEDEGTGIKDSGKVFETIPECQSTPCLHSWINIFGDAEYPKDFPHLTKMIYGDTIYEEGWESLVADQWINDSVLNSFFLLMRDAAEELKLQVLPFSSFFTQSLLSQDGLSDGFNRLLSSSDVWAKEIWLMPINIKKRSFSHWTLLVIILKEKTFLYIDSLHGKPPAILRPRVCALMESIPIPTSEKITGELDLSQWRFHIPHDYPSQVSASSSGNCGIHVCVWAFIICTGSNVDFHEDQMNQVRKAIATTLYKAPDTKERGIRHPRAKQTLVIGLIPSKKASKIQMVEVPPAQCSSTIEFCSSLLLNLTNSRTSMDKEQQVEDADERSVSLINIFSPVNKYPHGFPELQKSLFGVPFIVHDWETLNSNEMINDTVMNAYLGLLQVHARQVRQLKVLAFPSVLVASLMDEKVMLNYSLWSEVADIWSHHVWVLPIHKKEHWTLMIVIPEFNIMIYIDSLHKRIDPMLLPRIWAFIESAGNGGSKVRDLDPSQWTIYKPRDVPSQLACSGKTSNNCCTHVMSWVYVICTGIVYHFSEADMDHVRRGIARTLYGSSTEDAENALRETLTQIMLDGSGTSLVHRKIKFDVVQTPPMGADSTMEFLASLDQKLVSES